MDVVMNTVKGTLGRILPELVVDNILGAVLVIVIGSVLVRYLMGLARKGIARLPVNVTIQGFLIACIRLVLYFVVVLLACGILGIPISSLLALFGMAGLAVSLSLQNLLGNVVSGLVLLISKPFAVGDVIESGSVSGAVDSITLLHTHITTTSNKAVFVPNAEIMSAEIVNHNLHSTRMVEVTFSAPASAKMIDVKQAALGEVRKLPGFQATPEPLVHVSAMKPLSTDYVIRAWCDSTKYSEMHDAMFDAVKEGLEQAGITFAPMDASHAAH